MIVRNGVTEYEGKCLWTTSRGSIMESYDTDHYMIVWDSEAKATKEVFLFCDRAEKVDVLYNVDATPAVKAEYEAMKAERARQERIAEAERRALIPGRGKTLKVVRGRKVPKGTVGTCIWTGNGQWGERVGLKTASGEVHWTAMSNVEVVLAKAA